jgi:hypothetical protein
VGEISKNTDTKFLRYAPSFVGGRGAFIFREGEWADAVDLGFIFEGFNSQQIGNFHKTTCRLERVILDRK